MCLRRAPCVKRRKRTFGGGEKYREKALVLETPPPFGSRSHLLVRVRVGEARALAHHGVRGGGGEPPRAPRLERVVLGVLVARRVVARQGAVVEHHSAIPSARTKRSPIRRSEARRADAAVGARDPRREPTRAFLEGRSWTTRAARRDATARVAVGSVRRAQMCGPAEEIRINHTCSARQRRTPKRCDVWIHKQRTRGGSVRSFGFKRASSGRVRPVSSFKIGAGLKLNPRVRWKRPILSPPRRLRRCCLFYSLGRRLGGRPGGAPRVVVRGRARDRRTPTLAVVATDPGASPSGVSRVVGRRAPPSIRVASASAARGSRAPGAAASFSPPRPAS